MYQILAASKSHTGMCFFHSFRSFQVLSFYLVFESLITIVILKYLSVVYKKTLATGTIIRKKSTGSWDITTFSAIIHTFIGQQRKIVDPAPLTNVENCFENLFKPYRYMFGGWGLAGLLDRRPSDQLPVLEISGNRKLIQKFTGQCPVAIFNFTSFFLLILLLLLLL